MQNKYYYLSEPSIGNYEVGLVNNALESNWLSSNGKNTKLFKEKIKKKIKAKYISLVNSGTSAIHMALNCLQISTNDIVIAQSFTFAGTTNPILYNKATPVFIDSETDTMNLDPLLLEKAILFYLNKNIKPKAIIVVHIYGFPCKLDQIIKISKKYKIPVIEDAAEAFGSKINNRYCGSIGDIGILSFNANKILTGGFGGALITNNKKIYKNCEYLSSHAKSKKLYYHHSQIGYNYRFNNIAASICLGQMKSFNKKINLYLDNFKEYSKIVSKFDKLKIKKNFNNYSNSSIKTKANYWQVLITFDNKTLTKKSLYEIINIFKQNFIEVRFVWKPIHSQPVYNKYKFFGNQISENFFKNTLCFPNGVSLDKEYFKKLEFVLNKVI